MGCSIEAMMWYIILNQPQTGQTFSQMISGFDNRPIKFSGRRCCSSAAAAFSTPFWRWWSSSSGGVWIPFFDSPNWMGHGLLQLNSNHTAIGKAQNDNGHFWYHSHNNQGGLSSWFAMGELLMNKKGISRIWKERTWRCRSNCPLGWMSPTNARGGIADRCHQPQPASCLHYITISPYIVGSHHCFWLFGMPIFSLAKRQILRVYIYIHIIYMSTVYIYMICIYT